jgi:hypothetical protein
MIYYYYYYYYKNLLDKQYSGDEYNQCFDWKGLRIKQIKIFSDYFKM